MPVAHSGVVQRAEALLQGAGMILPPVPPAFRPTFRERGPWCFASRPLGRLSPYAIDHYVQEALAKPVADYVLLAHDGHGANSYAMHYFLVQRPLRLFLQVGWGGVYTDARVSTAQVNRCFRLAAELVATAEDASRRGRLDRDTWLTVVASDLYGGGWWPPGKEPAGAFSGGVRGVARGAAAVERDPTAVLRQAIAWCRRRAPGAGLAHAIVSEQGTRETLEDRHVVTECAGGRFAAVYDGHGGARTAEVVAAGLHQAFDRACQRGEAPAAAFRHAFAALDRATARHASGTTATCVFLKGSQLTAAHVGDSRAVLVGAGAPRPLTQDHRASHPAERQRIVKAGGRFDGGYVVRGDHGLMVTRSFGDRVFRPVGVIAEPEVTTVRLSRRDRFVVIATDGLWDVLSAPEVAALLTAHPWDAPAVADRLHAAVTARDPRDNVSAVVLRLLPIPSPARTQ